MFFTDNTNDCAICENLFVLLLRNLPLISQMFTDSYAQSSVKIRVIWEKNPQFYSRKFNFIIIKQSKHTIEPEYHI